MIKPFSSESACFFNFFSTIKVNLEAKIIQSAYFVLFFLPSTKKKSPFLAVLTWFLILSKIQDGGHFWWRHSPPAAPPPIKYTSSCREYQRLSTEGKIVSKQCNISKTLVGGGGGPSTPPTCTTVGVWICMYVRGLITRTVLSENNKKILPPVKHRSTLLCFALYRVLWPFCFPISASHTVQGIRKNVNPGKRVALSAEYLFPVSFV